MFCLLGGAVLAEFVSESIPTSHLIRPLLLAGAISVAAGVLSAVAGSVWPAVVVVMVAIPNRLGVLLCALVLVGLLVARMRRWEGDPTIGLVAVSVAFFVGGLIRAAPLVDLTSPATGTVDGSAVYLILLDGYPRVDSLAEIGYDNGPFVDELERRGFDHYRDARSSHTRTQLTLLAMLTGETLDDGPVHGTRSFYVRERLRLPDGFVTVAPPFGDSTVVGAVDIGRGGVTTLEVNLLAGSVLGYVPGVGDWVMDSLRRRVDDALEVAASTDYTRVFAHIPAPHQPYLYAPDGAAPVPPCWPCNIFWKSEPDDWPNQLAATLDTLNAGLLEMVDDIQDRRPDATIVLFSDHGGRFSSEESDEWHRSFLASYTPGKPGIFAHEPRPDAILSVVVSQP